MDDPSLPVSIEVENMTERALITETKCITENHEQNTVLTPISLFFPTLCKPNINFFIYKNDKKIMEEKHWRFKMQVPH